MSSRLDDLKPLDAPAEALPPPATPERLGLTAPGLAVVILALSVFLLVAAFQDYLYVPFFDVHDWIGRVFVVERTHDWLGYLWEPHTAERIPWARATEWLDIDLVRGRAPTFLIACVAAWLAGCIPFGVLLARSPLAKSTRVIIVLLAGLLLTDVSLAEDFAFPVFAVYLMVAGPALGAIALLQLSPSAGLRSPAFWSSLALAVAASGGNAAGLAVWPALIIATGLQRRGREQLLALLACSVICIAALESGLGAPSESLGRAGPLGPHLLKMGLYFLHFVGLPWTQSTPSGLALVIGLAVLASAIRVLWRTRWSVVAFASSLPGAAVALILFGLIAAVLATIGRVDEQPVVVVPTRYTPFATLLQLGVLIGLARDLDDLRKPVWAAAAITGLLAMMIFADDLHAYSSIHKGSQRIQAASAAFDRDSEAPYDRNVIHPRPVFARDIRQQLALRGLPH